MGDPIESFRARVDGRSFIYIEFSRDPADFEIDDLVTIDNKNTGIIQFISEETIGIRLIGTSAKRGYTDGTDSNGYRYFSCPEKDGMLVSPHRVTKRILTKPDHGRFKDALAMEGILLPTMKNATPVLSISGEQTNEILESKPVVPIPAANDEGKKSKADSGLEEEREPTTTSNAQDMPILNEEREQEFEVKKQVQESMIMKDKCQSPAEVRKSGSEEEIVVIEEKHPTVEEPEIVPFEVEARNFALEQQNKVLEERVEDLQRAIKKAKQERRKPTKESTIEVTTTQAPSKELQKENDDLKRELSELKQSLHATKEQLQDSEKIKESLQVQMQEDGEKIKNKNTILQSELSEAKARNDKLQIRIHELQEENRKTKYLEEQNEKLKETISEKEVEFKEEFVQIEGLLSEAQRVQMQIVNHYESLEQNNIDLEDRLIQYEHGQVESQSDLEDKITEIKKQQTKLEEQRASPEHEAELKRSQAAEEQYKLQISKLEAKVLELQNQLDANELMQQNQEAHFAEQEKSLERVMKMKNRFEELAKTTGEYNAVLEKRAVDFEKEKEAYKKNMQEKLNEYENKKNFVDRQVEVLEHKHIAEVEKIENDYEACLARVETLEKELKEANMNQVVKYCILNKDKLFQS